VEDPSTTLANGRFEIRGTLGSGGAGIVYRVHDQQLQREVALKLLKQASGRDLFRFKREFRTLADIVHPNLVALHELHATPRGDWYITMELVEGVSFIDWTRPGKSSGPARARADIQDAKLDVERLRAALPQLADALHALHIAGKLHRDLKPSNVLVTAKGRVVLLDFGLITSVAEGNPEHLAVGTPVYMSPEQASDQPLAAASDWYGVGAMLYEALTGRRPFEGGSEQVMTRKQSEQPPPPAPADGAPADLAKLTMAMLQPRAAARPIAKAIFDELGSAPSANTRAIERGVLGGFVGREKELERLDRALAEARRTGTAVLVCGKSGIGKSTLVRTFLASLGETVFVAAGRCFEREAVPFKMLDGVVDALTGAILTLPPVEVARIAPPEIGSLVRMFPVLRRIEQLSDLVTSSVPAEPQELRRRGFRGLKTLIGRLAQLQPVALFVDDAHWGDADSAAFFAQLIHEPERGTLVIIAHRPEDYLGVVATLRRPPGGVRRGELHEITVEPFDDATSKRVIAQLGVEHSEARAAMAIAAAAGNPLVLSEMARAPTLAASTGIDDLVRDRVLRLPVDAQAMLAVSSIAARPLPVEIAAHAAGVVGGLEAATRLSIERLATLHQVAGEMILHPAHDYVRTSVLANLDIETKAAFHEAIARAFEAVQGSERLDTLAVVEHWLAAGHPANAAHHAVGAAQVAEDLYAFRRAADLYEVALAFGPWDTTGQRDLLRRKAQALACAGQLDEAATVYGHAAQLLPDTEAIDLERLRVEALLRLGRLDEGLPAAELLLSQIGTRIPLGRTSRTRLATQWIAAKLRGLEFVEREPSTIPAADLLAIDVLYSIASGLAFADPTLGRVVQGELVRAALQAGEPIRVCLALAQEVWYAAAGGSRNRVAVDAVAQRLRAIATRVGRPEVVGFADASIGIATHMRGRWRDARASLEAGLTALRDRGAGVRWEIDIAETFWIATLFYLGEWREMSRQTLSLLRDAIDRADIVAQQNLRIGRCNFAWLALDRPDEAREQLEIAERSLPQDSFRIQDMSVMLAAANIDLYVGDARAAQRRIDATWDQLDRIGCLRLQQLRVELALLRARTQLALKGSDPEQQRAAREHASAMLKEGAPWASALGYLIRASCHAFAGTPEAARADLLAAEEHLVSTAMLGYLQIARLRRGQIEGGTLGASRVTAAREILGDLGATRVDAMIRHLLPWPETAT
jgi:eukaryotic-like serine/threonine-protein kinase